MNRDCHLERVRNYWRATHAEYLAHVGTTFQAGHLACGDARDAAAESNVRLANLAGITEGAIALDAGCGVCGPALDIARAIPGAHIVGITISPEQCAFAQSLIQAAGFSRVLQSLVADYHRVPFQAATFDVVYFFESAIYADDIRSLFREVFRVLKPRGTLYIKDVFHRPGALSKRAHDNLDEFDRTFACRTRSIGEFAEAIAAAGFEAIAERDITGQISTAHTLHAMFHSGDWRSGLTSFGERHLRFYNELPLFFGEIKAVRPR